MALSLSGFLAGIGCCKHPPEPSDAEQKDGPWIIAEGKENEKPILYRVRMSIPSNVEVSEYPYLMSILWEYDQENESGMPTSKQNEQQLSFDDALDAIDNAGAGILMIVVTGNGRREWIWYVNDKTQWSQQLHKALEGHAVYPIDIEQSEDGNWETYRTFKDNLK